METTLMVATVDGLLSSYRTYEEWKQERAREVRKGGEGFLPYLWGMETKKGVTER